MEQDIRLYAKNFLVNFFSSSLVQAVAWRILRLNTIFLAYHGISHDDDNYQAWTLVPKSAFRSQMAFLSENFDCIPIEEALTRNNVNSKKPGIVVTFDDGYANNLEIALPILEEFNIPATIYITTNHVLERKLFWPDIIWISARRSNLKSIDLTEISELNNSYDLNGIGDHWQNQVLKILEDIKKTSAECREKIIQQVENKFKLSHGAMNFRIEVEGNVFTPLTDEQIAKLSLNSLITIGAHSHCHNLLDQISLAQAERSIQKSKEILEKIICKNVKHFAYPNGNFNRNLVKIVRDMEFRSAVSFEPGFFKNGDCPYCINRFGIGSNVSLKLFKAILTGIFLLKCGVR